MADGTELAKAYVQIIPSAEGIQGKITDALGGEADAAGASAGKSFAGAFGGALKSIGVVATAAFSAAVAAAGAAAKGVLDIASIGDNIDKMSQKMGMSAQAYQEWDAVMQHSGTTIDAMQAGMKTLATAAETGNKAFDALGISQEALANMSQEELFGATIQSLQNVKDETQRTYLAGQLLGRGATELGALLNTSAEETDAMRARVHELGGVMSDDAVKAAAGFTDSMQDMKTALAGIARNMTGELLPSVKTVIDGLTEMFSGNSEAGVGMIREGVSSLLSGITEKLPEFLRIGGEILKAIGDAIIENLPELVRIGTDILVSLIEGIADNFDELADAAIDIILTLVDALIDNIDKVIAATVKIIVAIITKLTEPETLKAIIEAAIKLIVAVAKGIVEAIPELAKGLAKVIENILYTIGEWEAGIFDKGKELVAQLGAGIADAARSALQWGRDLVDNFIQGIKERIERVVETVKQLAQTVKDYLGFSEPDLGPLADFHTYAPDMMELFARGIRENAGLVTDAAASAFDLGGQIMGAAAAPALVPATAQNAGASSAQTGELPPIYATLTINGGDQTIINALAPRLEARWALRGKTF